MIALHSRTQRLRTPGPAFACQAKRGRGVLAVTKSSVLLDTVKTAHTSEVTVLIPTEQPSMTPVRTQRQFSGLSMVGALAAAALAIGFVANRLRKRGQEMGYNNQMPGRNDPFLNDVMKNVRTVQMDELPPELIAAARARRSRERANHKLDLEEVELPENHPWAMRMPMSHEQEAAIQSRLQVRLRTGRGGAAGGSAAGDDARPCTARKPRQ